MRRAEGLFNAIAAVPTFVWLALLTALAVWLVYLALKWTGNSR